MFLPGFPIFSKAGGAGVAEFIATNRTWAFDPNEAAFRTTVANGADTHLTSWRDMQGNADLTLANEAVNTAPRIINRRTKFMAEFDGSPASEILWGNDAAANGWWQYLRDPMQTHTVHLVWEAPTSLPTGEMLVMGSYYWWDLNSRFLYGIQGSAGGSRPFFRQRKADGTETTRLATSGTIAPGGRHLLTWICNNGVWDFAINGTLTTASGSNPTAGNVAAAATSFSFGLMREEPQNNIRPLRGYVGYFARYNGVHGSSELANMQAAAGTRYP